MSSKYGAEVDDLLRDLLAGARSVLGDRLAGLYLYGSLIAGDFTPGVSDVDLLAVTPSLIDAREFDALDRMHARLVSERPGWENRLEILYVPADALETFRTRASRIAVISPGEPFHFVEAGDDWLINWWSVRSEGVALHGPPASAFIGPISKEEFLASVRREAAAWRARVYKERMRKGQSYGVLTMCRALYTHENGVKASKLRAARWASELMPQWAATIQGAIEWRSAARNEETNEAATAEAASFINFVADRIEGRAGGR